MTPRLIAVAVVASSLGILAACGGAKESDLFGAPGASEFTDSNPTEPAPSTSSNGGSNEQGGSSGLTSSGGGSSSTSSGGGSTTSSSSSGGSTSSSSSGGSTSSSGGTTTSKGIWCGEDDDKNAVYCKAGSACCATGSGWGGPQLECANNFGCNGAISIKCDDETDCPKGNVCCGTFEQNSGYKQVACAPSCQSTGGSLTQVRFCDQNAAVDECASIGKTCGWSQSLPGYSVCK